MSRESFPKVRRQDRAKEDTWAREFLAESPMGQVAVNHDGHPYIVSNTFVYDAPNNALYFHTAGNGYLRTILESGDGRACFSCSVMGRLLPADTMKELSVEYSSVVAFGSLQIVTVQKDQRRALELLAQKYFPHLEAGKDIRPLTPGEVSETTVYRFEIEHLTGKQKKVDDEFPGSFRYGDAPA
jgi:hypothetical protein